MRPSRPVSYTHLDVYKRQAYDKAKIEMLELQRQQMRAAGVRMQSYRSWAAWAAMADVYKRQPP